MTKKTINGLINTFFISIFIYIFIYSNIVKRNITVGINIWLYSLIPTLFPFLLITKILINYNIFDIINTIFGKIIEKIFHISKNSSFIVIISMLTGFPTGSIYIKDLLEKDLISIEEANKLITFTSFANPIFVISFIGETLLNNRSIGIYIFLIHLFTGLLLGIFIKCNNINHAYKKHNLNKSFITILTISINESFKTLINMLGIIIFFLIILSIIDTFIPSSLIILVLKGFIEITMGVTNIANSYLNTRLKVAIISSLLSFNGLSVHFQIKSIIDNTQIKYNKYLFARILHSLLCFIVSYILFNLIIN